MVYERFQNSDIQDLKSGYVSDTEWFSCLYCNERFERGVVYPHGSRYMDAERAAREHVREEHAGPFRALCRVGSGATGLSEIQRQVIELSGQGLADREIGREMGGKAASTIRNHRFQLKRRAREAKVLIAVMDMLEEREDRAGEFIQFRQEITTDDDRIIITEKEAREVLEKYFDDSDRRKLSKFPRKQKEKLVVLREIASLFESGQTYTEKEVNDIILAVYYDCATIRRYLVEYNFMTRKPGGKAYRLSY